MSRRFVVGGVAFAFFCVGLVISSLGSRAQPVFPNEVTAQDITSLPALIPVADSHGNLVGYAKRQDVFGPPPPPGSDAAYSTPNGTPVYDGSGRTLIGYVNADGFTPTPTPTP